jgi:tripartite-type tricarboxylate transporter receptor subunit TctC
MSMRANQAPRRSALGRTFKRLSTVACAALAMAAPAAWAWEPTKPVEFVVPAGTGGGADQMARFIQGVIVKHKLMKQPMVVVNKSGGAGAEGFLESRSQGRPAQDHHHPVQPVHHAAGHRRALQLEGHDAGVDAGA